jgi:hypothetical protein
LTRKTRINLALALMATGIVFNVVILFQGDASVGWPIAAIIFFGAAGAALVSERRQP